MPGAQCVGCWEWSLEVGSGLTSVILQGWGQTSPPKSLSLGSTLDTPNQALAFDVSQLHQHLGPGSQLAFPGLGSAEGRRSGWLDTAKVLQWSSSL